MVHLKRKFIEWTENLWTLQHKWGSFFHYLKDYHRLPVGVDRLDEQLTNEDLSLFELPALIFYFCTHPEHHLNHCRRLSSIAHEYHWSLSHLGNNQNKFVTETKPTLRIIPNGVL